MKKTMPLAFILMLTSLLSFAQKSGSYPVVVSFNSMCCGVPDDAPLMRLIRDFKKQYRIKRMAADHIGPMGREGEYYLAFRLKELNKVQKQKFIQQLKKIIPTMNDRGSAEVKENVVIDKAELSNMTTITTRNL